MFHIGTCFSFADFWHHLANQRVVWNLKPLDQRIKGKNEYVVTWMNLRNTTSPTAPSGPVVEGEVIVVIYHYL